MKKIIVLAILLVFITLYVVSANENYMAVASKFKYESNSIFASDKYRFGDLFGFSYLPSFKELKATDTSQIQVKKFMVNRPMQLWLLHDSYLGKDFLKNKEQFSGVQVLHDVEYPWWRGKRSEATLLDTTKTNVLIFEITERDLYRLNLNIVKEMLTPSSDKLLANNTSLSNFANDYFFDKNINTNLEFLLFDTRIFTPIKEAKSYLNYELFNRLDPNVFLSKNKNYLFFSETKSSIQTAITDSMLKTFVRKLNNIYDYCTGIGFRSIYFSIIPNPISIVKPDCQNYNKLIPLIQGDPLLRMPMIDCYSAFKKAEVNVYFHSDSHWNKSGFQLWLNITNSFLAEN